jgi:isoleucyl-tRNA synthetase
VEEGFVRELISKLQTMRKEAGFEVQDRVGVCLEAEQRLMDVFVRNRGQITHEVLADEVSQVRLPFSKEWSINGESAILSLKKL